MRPIISHYITYEQILETETQNKVKCLFKQVYDKLYNGVLFLVKGHDPIKESIQKM